MIITKEPDMQAKCNTCECEFTFEKEDIKKYGGSGGKTQPRMYLAVICPVCNSVIEIWGNSKGE